MLSQSLLISKIIIKQVIKNVKWKYVIFPINNFPGILGCIDGTYIPIRTTAHTTAHKIKST